MAEEVKPNNYRIGEAADVVAEMQEIIAAHGNDPAYAEVVRYARAVQAAALEAK